MTNKRENNAKNQAARRERNRENYLGAMVLPAGTRAMLQTLADREGISLAGMIQKAVLAYDQPQPTEQCSTAHPKLKLTKEEKAGNRATANELLRSAGYDRKTAGALLRGHMQKIYPGFKTNETGTHASLVYKGISDRIGRLSKD